MLNRVFGNGDNLDKNNNHSEAVWLIQVIITPEDQPAEAEDVYATYSKEHALEQAISLCYRENLINSPEDKEEALLGFEEFGSYGQLKDGLLTTVLVQTIPINNPIYSD